MEVNLRVWRLRRGMTMEQLAKATGLSARTIGRIESQGVIPYPSTLIKLAQALNISTEQLLVEKEEKMLQKAG